MKRYLFNTKLFSTVIRLFFAATLIIASGCGNGGGGGAAPAPSGGNTNNPPATGDKTAPVLALVDPAPNSSDTEDVELWDGNFKITFSCADASMIDEDTISVKFQMDSGVENDISSYFSVASQELKSGKYESIIISSGIFNFTKTLFTVQSNNQDRVMKVIFSLKDASGNKGTTTSQFTVVRAAPPG